MKWTDRYSTGIARIDEQHKMLFKTTEDYRTTLESGEGERTYGLVLEFLTDYVRAHFADEEGCMEQWRCPVARNNKEAHQKFVQILSGFRMRFATHGFVRADAQRLLDEIDHWLANHIGRIDVQLKPCVEAFDPGPEESG